nr:reverse transcriptase domain-containing protein [Tanacetum cinerariifolium]
MCRSLNGSQNVGLQRHCILVAASNPGSRPPDAEKVAKSFPQSFVSLSVICPMQLPKLRAIYNAGKRNPSVAVADPNTEIVKHTQYVGLISKDLLQDMNMMVTSLPQTTVTSAEKLRIAHKIWSRYVKVWEGDLYGVQLGQPALVTRLQAYMIPSASKSLAKDWPSLMQIDHYSLDYTESLKKQYVKRAYFVLFRAMHRHELLISLQKDKLCAVIKLPSQNLLLTVAGKPDRFMGMLFPVQQVASQQQQQQKLMAGTGMNQGSGGSTQSVDRGQLELEVFELGQNGRGRAGFGEILLSASLNLETYKFANIIVDVLNMFSQKNHACNKTRRKRRHDSRIHSSYDRSGTKGVVGLSRWVKKMESVFHISGCAVENQVKFATCTMLDVALTWWNGHVRTLGHKDAYAMTWETFKKRLTNEYCPKGEIKKLEIELWNFKVKGNDVGGYTQCFQESALMCTEFLSDETEKVDKYINGLPDNIHGNVMSARPKTLDFAIELANELMDQKHRTYAERQAENKRKLDNNNQDQQQLLKKQNVVQAYAENGVFLGFFQTIYNLVLDREMLDPYREGGGISESLGIE